MPPPLDPQVHDSGAGTIVIFCFSILGLSLAAICTYALFGPTLFVMALLFGTIGGLHYLLWGRSMTDAGGGDSTGTSAES